MKKIMKTAVLTGLIGLAAHNPAFASKNDEERLTDLEKNMELLLQELQKKQNSIDTLNQQVNTLLRQLEGKQPRPSAVTATDPPDETELREIVAEAVRKQETSLSRFSLGGYGEIHANIAEGSDSSGNSNDVLDIHRLVGYIGYEFADWIKFQSEIELEHALVADTNDGSVGGEVELEQAYVDFLLSDQANIRVGRTLVPLGIINQHHEPTTFNGVERPSFATYIIPTTWRSDGIGVFGNLADFLSYEASVIAGLDGSQFSATKGIRNGRIKERPSLNDLALTFRLDYFPFLNTTVPFGQNLRLGASFYHGGFNNGNKGKDPGVNGDLTIYSADFTASIAKFDFKGVYAFEEIDGAENLNGVAEEIMGYYLEAGYHFWPESWKSGKFKKSDAIAFVRYDDYDTQYKMPAGVAENPAGDRYDWTIGLSFYPVPNLVLKTGYQIRKSAAANDPDNTFNLGIGWQF